MARFTRAYATVIKINIVPVGGGMTGGAVAGVVAAGRCMARLALIPIAMIYINRVPIAGVVAAFARRRIVRLRRIVAMAAIAFKRNGVVKIYIIPTVGGMAVGALSVIMIGFVVAALAVIKAGVIKHVHSPIFGIVAF